MKPRVPALSAVAAIVLCFVALPVRAAPPATAGPAAIDAVVERYRAAAGVPGVAVAVTRGTAVVRAAGYGRTADGRPLTDRTVLATASVSKSFTALAVLRLADAGRLSLDRPVRRYLPEFVTADPRASAITVRRLLDQTSGLSDGTLAQFTRAQPRTLRESVAGFRGTRLATAPGTHWAYYNPNYQIAARLVEVVSGQPFDTYLADHVFGPLGMTGSRAVATDRDLPASARGHLKLLGRPFAVPEPAAFGAGSGGVLSTAHDMAAWLIMQSDRGRAPGGAALVSPASLTAMHTPSSPASGGYALGWATGRAPSGAPLISHGGDLFTATAYEALLPESGYGIAVMANTGLAYGDAEAIGARLVALLDGAPVPAVSGMPTAVDAVLLGLAVAALATGTAGVLRARRWAAARRNLATAVVRLAPLPVPFLLFVAIHRIIGALYQGRDVRWTQACYLYPSFMIFLGAAALAGSAVLAARLVRVNGGREGGSRG